MSKPPSHIGRPSKLTAYRVFRVCQSVRGGNFLETAFRYGGLRSKATAFQWLADALDLKEPEAVRQEPEYVMMVETVHAMLHWKPAEGPGGVPLDVDKAGKPFPTDYSPGGITAAALLAFSDLLEDANTAAEVGGVTRIRTHGLKDWTAEAWYMERRFPERWGRWRLGLTEESAKRQAAGPVGALKPGEGPGLSESVFLIPDNGRDAVRSEVPSISPEGPQPKRAVRRARGQTTKNTRRKGKA